MSETSFDPGSRSADIQHQQETGIVGTWLFLATEILFFGPLFLVWLWCRYRNTAGFDFGAQRTDLLLGTINTTVLVTSSLAYSAGLAFIKRNERGRFIQCCVAAWLLGASFLVLKFCIEWREDFARDLFPGDSFSIEGEMGPGAQLFFVFYFVSTAIHGLHIIVGLGLVGWIIANAKRFGGERNNAVTIVGLYWSFVDMIWVFLYPLIYLIGRTG